MSMTAEAAKQLREPFPDNLIGQLPRAGTTLAFVGHAAVTDRLLQVDPAFEFEPFVDGNGQPVIHYSEIEASLWVRLTVLGVTRCEVGVVQVGAKDLHKQLMSDALRRAAMRFGVALDLWSKEDLQAEPRKPASIDRRSRIAASVKALSATGQSELSAWWGEQGFGSTKRTSTHPITDDEADAVEARIAQMTAAEAPFTEEES